MLKLWFTRIYENTQALLHLMTFGDHLAILSSYVYENDLKPKHLALYKYISLIINIPISYLCYQACLNSKESF